MLTLGKNIKGKGGITGYNRGLCICNVFLKNIINKEFYTDVIYHNTSF